MDAKSMDKLLNLMERENIPMHHARILSVLLKEVYLSGRKEGVKSFAYLSDGIVVVGNKGKTLQIAIAEIESDYDKTTTQQAHHDPEVGVDPYGELGGEVAIKIEPKKRGRKKKWQDKPTSL
jgi:hypothetical protein